MSMDQISSSRLVMFELHDVELQFASDIGRSSLEVLEEDRSREEG
jgi:hypothetical protein